MTAEKTGWPPGMLQDDDKKLSQWLASRPDARLRAREVAAEIAYRPDITEEAVKAQGAAAAKTGERCPYESWSDPWFWWQRYFLEAGGGQS